MATLVGSDPGTNPTLTQDPLRRTGSWENITDEISADPGTGPRSALLADASVPEDLLTVGSSTISAEESHPPEFTGADTDPLALDSEEEEDIVGIQGERVNSSTVHDAIEPVVSQQTRNPSGENIERTEPRTESREASRRHNLDVSLLARHIEHMQRICRASLEDLPQSRQRRQVIRLQGIRRMLEDLHRQIRNLQVTQNFNGILKEIFFGGIF